MKYLVAVYGTLKQNEYNHYLMQQSGAEHVVTTVTKAPFVMFDGSFPMVNKSDGGEEMESFKTPIKVEVYAVKTLDMLDRLEGHPDFFHREQVEVEGLDDTPWMYIAPSNHGRADIVQDGNWTDHYSFDYED